MQGSPKTIPTPTETMLDLASGCRAPDVVAAPTFGFGAAQDMDLGTREWGGRD